MDCNEEGILASDRAKVFEVRSMALQLSAKVVFWADEGLVVPVEVSRALAVGLSFVVSIVPAACGWHDRFVK